MQEAHTTERRAAEQARHAASSLLTTVIFAAPLLAGLALCRIAATTIG